MLRHRRRHHRGPSLRRRSGPDGRARLRVRKGPYPGTMRGISNLLSSLLSKTGPGRVTLEIDLDRGVLRAAPENPLEAFRAINAPTINGLTTALREGVSDERVAGLVVHIGTCPLSASMVDEVGAAIRQFGEHKPPVAYAETLSLIHI